MLQRLTKGQQAQLPDENVRNDSFLERLFVTWVYAIVTAGRKGLLQADKLCMPKEQAAEVSAQRFQEAWTTELTKTSAAAATDDPKHRQPSLLHALMSTFWVQFALAGVFKLMWSGCVLLGASYFVNSLIEFVQKKEGWDAIPNKGVGWVLACAFFMDSILAGLALQRMGDMAVRLGIKVRGALIAAIYRKTFRLQSLHGNDAGNVVSLVATDCIKMYEGVQHFHNVWTAPLEAAAIIGLLLWRTGGVFGLPALGVVMVVLPLQYYFGYMIASYKMQNVEVSDARVLRMHEVLLAIKLVKFYVWERSFARQVEDVREKELELIRKSALVKTANLCLVFAVPPSIALVIFATYAYSVGPLTPSMAFVVLSLFNTLRFPLVVLPKALRGASEALAAMRRIQTFLLLPESEQQVPAAEPQAVIENAKLHYGDPAEFTLTVPQFSVKPGDVVAIVGRVGCGKSSILQAILSKMITLEGRVDVGGSIAYVPQTPWVQNLSLRDNILFGMPYDEAKYKAVIHACALELDLKILPNGDASIAGERGINLSGGQRQRVCLARAAYHDAQLVLLDNPLSAVDQHTSKHIFDKCIKGLLVDKAVVLVAHQLELLPQCDKVAIVKDSAVVYFGPYDAAAINTHMPVDHMLSDATVEAKDSAATPAAADKDGGQDGKDLIKAVHHARTESVAPIDDLLETPEEIAAKFNGTCKRLGARQAAYVYWQSGGLTLGLISLFIFAFTQTTRIMGDWWIRAWSADEPARFIHLYGIARSNQLYLLIYMALVLLFISLLLTRDSVFSAWSVRASTRLHNQVFRRVLAAPILFFLRTPVGDVLNAFARDQDTLDETLPDTLHMTGIYLMILLTSLAIVTVSIYYYAIMTGALFLAFAMMQYLYLPAATLLKRWAGDTASTLFVHVDESLQGMDVIRAFDAVNYFIQENVNLLNMHHLALFNMEQTNLWLAFWCDFLGAVLVVATCLFSVAFSETLGAPNVGLAISNSIQVLVFFTWVVRGVADTVSMWDAIERVTSFATQACLAARTVALISTTAAACMGKCKGLQKPPSKASRSFLSSWLTAPRSSKGNTEGCSLEQGTGSPSSRLSWLLLWLFLVGMQCAWGAPPVQVPVEVTDADEAAEAEAHQQSPKQLPHRYQLRGGPSSTSLTAPISRVLSGTRSGGSMVGSQTSKRHHRTADDRRQASLRMASTSRADPVMAAAAAAALQHEGHGRHHPHLHAVAKHILHHGHRHHHGPEHATITVSAEGTAEKQEQQSAPGSADGSKGSVFASLDGQSKTAAVILGESGLAVAGMAKPEAKAEATTTAVVPVGWPASGDLRFEDVSLRYFPGGPLALRHVNFHVQSCEKVGIVGRTGSGKTTLLMALFRMIGLAGGRIVMDGVDIGALPLREVRRAISIIPQEPVMFKGTVRSNLDPFGTASDNELWHALALVHLKAAIADLPGGLDGVVAEGGSNFSLGQKQLICMARCVLKPSHILVLDEATAAMDLQTDALIQRTIRRVFAERATLTIAHRLDTIIFSDKILAMAQGQVKEFDKPSTLLDDPRSMFNKLVEDTGPVASAMLRQMAAAGPQDGPYSQNSSRKVSEAGVSSSRRVSNRGSEPFSARGSVALPMPPAAAGSSANSSPGSSK